MTSVTARRTAKGLARGLHTCAGAVYRGYMLGYPVIGKGVVIIRHQSERRLLTSPVIRVLSDALGASIYVETENSIYRISVHEE